MISRRHFVKLSLATIPLTAYAAGIKNVVDGVHLGCITYNWHDLPQIPGAVNQVDAWIKVLAQIGIGEIELMNLVVQPTALNPPQAGRGAATLTPEQQKAQQELRENLRKWRLNTPMNELTDVRKKFNRAGIKIDSYGCNFGNDYTDGEFEKTFQQAKSLGVSCIATSTQLPVAKRLVPFAEKHKMIVAFHNLSNVTDPEQIGSIASLQAVYDMSRFFVTNIDIGHMTAANIDAVDYIRQNHSRISFLHFNDRKKDQGPSLPYGQGDTPFKEVLQLVRKNRYPLPCILEVDYPIPEGSTTLVEWKKCLDYLKQALA